MSAAPWRIGETTGDGKVSTTDEEGYTTRDLAKRECMIRNRNRPDPQQWWVVLGDAGLPQWPQ